MNVIDVGAGWNAQPEIAAPAPIPTVERELTPEQITSQKTTIAETAVGSIVEAVDEEATFVEQSQSEPIPTTTPEAEVAEATVPEAVETGEIDNELPVENKVAEPNSLPVVTPVVPAWEIDRFHWPADIETLFEEQADYFEHAGHKLLAASREGLSKLAITSARPGEGTTTVTLCLARAVAAAGGRVALLDGNLRNAQISRALSLEFASGWQVAAAGAVELAEAAIASLQESITLFPAAATVEGASSLADESVGELLQRARAGFDLLLIDAGQEDLGENAAQIDAAMVVRDVRRTSGQQSLATALLLKEAGVKAVGIAENFSEAHASAAAA
jgi:Mrp family chromosome partitioning ATPase